jgi:metal-responsive CopG/Arc/MetJ family transcriptional regulator
MAKIKLEKDLYEKAKKVSETAGYSSVDEFVAHVVEKELRNISGGDGEPEDEEKLKERLRGLGYIS